MSYATPHALIATAVVLPSLGTIAVSLRFYVRKIKGLRPGIDDWTILLALVLTWILAIILFVGKYNSRKKVRCPMLIDVFEGYTLGSFTAPTVFNKKTGAIVYKKSRVTLIKVKFSYILVLALTLGIIKLSVVLLYRRIFVGRLFNHYSLAMCTLIILWSLSFFFATAFQCGAHIKYWWTDFSTTEKHCVDTNALSLGFGISDVITDLMVLAIPLPIVWKLQMPRSQKVALSGVFLLGLLSTAAGVARMRNVFFNVYHRRQNYRDLIRPSRDVAVWSQVEAGVALVAACLPTLRPLFGSLVPERLIRSLRSMLSGRSQRTPKVRGSESKLVASGQTDRIPLARARGGGR